MGKGSNLTLQDIGDAMFRVLMHHLNRKEMDAGAELTISTGDLQESLFMNLSDRSSILVKTFPHKNYLHQNVYRIEVYKTRPGDLRGNRVAFIETPQNDSALAEIRQFIEGILIQSGL
jgi:hypothetical protein